jgi:hypothetical protein
MGSAGPEFTSVEQAQSRITVPFSPYVLNPIYRDNCPAMDSDEAIRIQFRFETGQRVTNQMGARTDMKG